MHAFEGRAFFLGGHVAARCVDAETWKTAPRLESMALLAHLASGLIQVAPNTILSHAKLMQAIHITNAPPSPAHPGPVIFSTKNVNTEINILSSRVRCHLSKWKEVAQCEAKLRTVLRKAKFTTLAHKHKQPTDTATATDTDADKDTDTDTDTDPDTQTHRHTDTETHRHMHRHTDTQTH
jgi:hypothetical protein